MPAIGIDLGTTYCCVGVWKQGKVEIIANEKGFRKIPSYVAFANTERLIGDMAKDQAIMNPANTVFNAKRLIGRKFDDPKVQNDTKHWPFKVVSEDEKPKIEVEFRGVPNRFYPEDISSMVLRKMKEIAEFYLGKPVKDAVISVPANFNNYQRQATRNAGIIAGLNVLRIISEPTAAALTYCTDEKIDGERNMLIFDLGGGTFDVSIITIYEGSMFEVRSIAGDTHLGGEDFDTRLADHFYQEFENKYRKNIKLSPTSLIELRIAAERAKRVLSSSTETIVKLDAIHKGYNSKITRACFEELCCDLFGSILEPVEKALAEANLEKTSISEVILVGGSTRIPKIRSILQNFFCGKQLINQSFNPDVAVAYGSAVQAAIMIGEDTRYPNLCDLLLSDVTPYTLGIETASGLMKNFIERNTGIPRKQTHTFTTYTDNQTAVTIKVFEGEFARSKNNNIIGMYELNGIEPAPRGVPKIDVTLDMDADGIINVTARDKASGRGINARITRRKGKFSHGRMVYCAAFERLSEDEPAP